MTRASALPLVCLACAFALGCAKETTQTKTPEQPGSNADADVVAPLPDPVNEPTNREEGEVLALTLPRIGGDALDLGDLRGRVVVIELSAAWVDGWSERYSFYNELLREHGSERVAVVLVSMDGEREAIGSEPQVRGPGFELAWDPQGAIAAQLQAAAVPTVIVLDPSGRIAHIVATDVTQQAITEALVSTLAGP